MLSYKTIQPDTLELMRRLMAEPLFAGMYHSKQEAATPCFRSVRGISTSFLFNSIAVREIIIRASRCSIGCAATLSKCVCMSHCRHRLLQLLCKFFDGSDSQLRPVNLLEDVEMSIVGHNVFGIGCYSTINKLIIISIGLN